MFHFPLPLILLTLALPYSGMAAESDSSSPFGSTSNGPTKNQIIPLQKKDIKAPVISADEKGIINLTADKAHLKGKDCKLENRYGFPSIGVFNKAGDQVAWLMNVPKAGEYIVEVRYSCPEYYKPPSSLVDVRSGSHLCPWNMVATSTGYWNNFNTRHIGTIQLDAGEQPFVLTLLANYAVNIDTIRLIPSPGQVVKPNEAGEFVLKPDTADLSEGYVNRVKSIATSQRISWLINSPSTQRYEVIINGSCPSGAQYELSCGNSTANFAPARTENWDTFVDFTATTVILPAGQNTITLKNQQGQFDMKYVTLKPTGEDLDAKIKELEGKPRIGMDKKDLETIWGGCASRNPDSFLKLHGTNKAESDFYKGVESSCKAFQWTLPDMTVTGVFLNDKCINLIVKMPNQTFAAARELMGKLMPGIEFATAPITTEPPYILPSKDKVYQLLYWGDCFEVRAPGSVHEVRESAEKEFQKLISRVRLGMSLEQLQEILGKGNTRQNFDLERNAAGDTDSNIYKGINKRCTGNIWAFPANADSHITAIMFNGTCIGLDISQRNGFTAEEALNLAQTFIPNVQFNVTPARLAPNMTYYSTNYNKGYKMQFRGAYLELKASSLLKALLLEELGFGTSKKPAIAGADGNDPASSSAQKQSAMALVNLLQKNPALKSAPIFGRTAAEIDAILGKSEEIDPSLTILPTRVWKIKGSTYRLTGTFAQKNNKDVLNSISIVDESGNITPAIALFVAKKLIAPYTSGTPDGAQMSSSFTLPSLDAQQRFTIEWTPDDKKSGIIRVADKN